MELSQIYFWKVMIVKKDFCGYQIMFSGDEGSLIPFFQIVFILTRGWFVLLSTVLGSSGVSVDEL